MNNTFHLLKIQPIAIKHLFVTNRRPVQILTNCEVRERSMTVTLRSEREKHESHIFLRSPCMSRDGLCNNRRCVRFDDDSGRQRNKLESISEIAEKLGKKIHKTLE